MRGVNGKGYLDGMDGDGGYEVGKEVKGEGREE